MENNTNTEIDQSNIIAPNALIIPEIEETIDIINDQNDDIATTTVTEQTAITNKIINPLMLKTKITTYDGIIDYPNRVQYKDLRKLYKKILVLCLKTTEPIDDQIYEEYIDSEFLESNKTKLTIMNGIFELLRNNIHKEDLRVIDKKTLEIFNHNNIQFEETELVIPMLIFNENDLDIYIKQYIGLFTFDDYINTKVIRDFYCSSDKSEILSQNLYEIIKNVQESMYWTYDYNCKLNITEKFINRKFSYGNYSRFSDQNICNVIDKLKKIPDEGTNYLAFMFNKQTYVDAATAIQKGGYHLYRINEEIDIKITSNFINTFANSITTRKEFYNFITTLMSSKKYCHLIGNNPFILNKLSEKGLHGLCKYNAQSVCTKISMFDKYAPIFKYIIGYMMLTMYLEESIKKTFILSTDRFVFDINTASKLPYYPYDLSDQHTSPYLPILVSNKVLDYNKNFMGIGCLKDHVGGINTFEDFMKNFKIFCNNDVSWNIFDGLNWSDVAVCGGVMAACIPKNNPLMKLFENTPGCDTYEKTLTRYFDEYYTASDIDIICGKSDIFDYVDQVNHIFETVKKNIIDHIKITNESIRLQCTKTVAVIVNEQFIKKSIIPNAIKQDSKYTLEYIISHLKDTDIKQLFYKNYIIEKTNENIKYMNDPKYENKWTDNKYKDIFDIIPAENIILIIGKTQKEWEDYNKKFREKKSTTPPEQKYIFKDEITDEDLMFEDQDPFKDELEEDNYTETDELCKISENLKFKVDSIFMKHPLEIFKSRFPEVFSTVAKFHLPCVRAYYNGTTVKMLPSAVCAYMTFMNIDYKYFAGTKDPIEIINKYRTRGFGTFLNDYEKIHLIEYSNSVPQWQSLYDINKKKKETINDVFGVKQLNDKLFKPRKYNDTLFTKFAHVADNYNTVNYQIIDKKDIYIQEFSKIYNYDETDSDLKLLSYNTINNNGYIEPFKKWVLDAGYDLL